MLIHRMAPLACVRFAIPKSDPAAPLTSLTPSIIVKNHLYSGVITVYL